MTVNVRAKAAVFAAGCTRVSDDVVEPRSTASGSGSVIAIEAGQAGSKIGGNFPIPRTSHSLNHCPDQ